MTDKTRIRLLTKALVKAQNRFQYIGGAEPARLMTQEGVKETLRLCDDGWRVIEDTFCKLEVE